MIAALSDLELAYREAGGQKAKGPGALTAEQEMAKALGYSSEFKECVSRLSAMNLVPTPARRVWMCSCACESRLEVLNSRLSRRMCWRLSE